MSAGRLRACADLAQAREQTRATTGCGSCTATCAQLVGTAAADPACEVVRTK
ncbi:hypothetical protein [Nocardioides marinisabuli]|uniref:hypothetical protein n=1 Tax=Nocardioides marinisabuli TaxID=419476 RepID=UPI002155BD12|nr:hypothetical protein [Nocardioides marinisabuli]